MVKATIDRIEMSTRATAAHTLQFTPQLVKTENGRAVLEPHAIVSLQQMFLSDVALASATAEDALLGLLDTAAWLRFEHVTKYCAERFPAKKVEAEWEREGVVGEAERREWVEMSEEAQAVTCFVLDLLGLETAAEARALQGGEEAMEAYFGDCVGSKEAVQVLGKCAAVQSRIMDTVLKEIQEKKEGSKSSGEKSSEEEHSDEHPVQEEHSDEHVMQEEHSNEEPVQEEHSDEHPVQEEHSDEHPVQEEHSDEDQPVQEEHSNEEPSNEEHSDDDGNRPIVFDDLPNDIWEALMGQLRDRLESDSSDDEPEKKEYVARVSVGSLLSRLLFHLTEVEEGESVLRAFDSRVSRTMALITFVAKDDPAFANLEKIPEITQHMYYLEALEEEEETLAARLQTCSDEDRPAVREEHDALMAQAAEIIVKVCFLLFRVMLPVAVRVAAPLLDSSRCVGVMLEPFQLLTNALMTTSPVASQNSRDGCPA